MSTKTIKPRHPENELLKDVEARDAQVRSERKGGITKTATLVKAGDTEGLLTGGVSAPSAEQLAKINEFTRTSKTADELYVFDTLSMNDIADRDDDFFTTECVKGFAALPQPFSPLGKSFMTDHEYKVANAKGRIFDVDTKTVAPEGGDSATFLTNSIYIPNTPQNAGFVEDIDFGINWAVSVGVTLGKTFCTVCESPFSSWGLWCSEGHDKGLSYDPESDEEDAYGWPKAIDPEDPKAVKCLRGFEDPKDFYELSQVFLGAQYYAALDKTAGISTAKTFGGFAAVPLKEAKKLPNMHHEPKEITEAREKFGVETLDDGSLRWKDADSLLWTFDPLEPEEGVLSLGRSVEGTTEEENEDGEHTIPDAQLDADDSGDDEEGSDDSEAESGSEGSGSDEEDSEEEVEDEDDQDDEDKQAKAVKISSLATLFPPEIKDAIKASSPAEAIKAMSDHLVELDKFVDAGREYLKELRVSAIDWYSKANMAGDGRGVKTSAFQKMLDRVGDDTELLKEIIQEQKEQAQKRFPAKVRRSSVPSGDPNVRPTVGEIKDSDFGLDEENAKIERLHGRK